MRLPPAHRKTFQRPRVTLTKAEVEWLGVYVYAGSGGPWQVWSMHPRNGLVWLVRGGESREASVSVLRRVPVPVNVPLDA